MADRPAGKAGNHPGIAGRTRLRDGCRALWVLLGATIGGLAADAKRCDLVLKSTPIAGGQAGCLDLLAVKGAAILTAQNATRIGHDGLVLCKNAFSSASGGVADITFLYDNSGSMVARYAWIDPAGQDTTYYYGTVGCASAAIQGEVVFQTQTGTKAVPRLTSNAGCSQLAGDPYNARVAAIRLGLDFLAANSPLSTASSAAFTNELAHMQPPALLNSPAALDKAKNGIIGDSTNGGTEYGKPLRQAAGWLTDTVLTNTPKQVIIFISDGAPEDTVPGNSYVTSIYPGIPIFSIFLGKPNSPYQKMQDLSTRTGGGFNLVDPADVNQMKLVIEQIIRSFTVVTLPKSLQIANASLDADPDPDQVSTSLSLGRTPGDSNISVVLDSVLALQAGLNQLSVKLSFGDREATFAFTVKSDGPAAAQSSPTLACHDAPTLVMLNQAQQVEPAYSGGPARYDVRLTRSPSELTHVTVTAKTEDSTKAQPWGDAEPVFLPMTGSAGGIVTNQRGAFPFLGDTPGPAAGNGTLEASPDGRAVLSWVHPRDPREAARFVLPAKAIPLKPGFIMVERVLDAPRGVAINEHVENPVVIRGGVVIQRVGRDSVVLSDKGCIYNCAGSAIRLSDPLATPSFIFKTAAPFAFTLQVYDNLGHFVLKAKGTVPPAAWHAMPKIGDSVAVLMSIIPVAGNGVQSGTGAYILRAIIDASGGKPSGPGPPGRIAPVSGNFVKKFGYIRAMPR